MRICSFDIFSIRDGSAGTVEVDRFFEADFKFQVSVDAHKFQVIPIGNFNYGDIVSIRADPLDKLYNDITLCLIDESEVASYPNGVLCKGVVRGKMPFSVKIQAESPGNKFIVFDNRFSHFSKRSAMVHGKFRKAMSDDDIYKLKNSFKKLNAMMSSVFEDADLDIYFKPCGFSNAYSDNKTADITICSEFIGEIGGNYGEILVPVLFHEYAHSLLNRWGEPGSSEEDIADQFAVVMMLRLGDRGREILLKWVDYWLSRDSRAESQNQLQRGDTHSISVQRARNIRTMMNFPDEVTRRWNKMLYRHMTQEALREIIRHPIRMDDVDLAKEALRQK